MNQGSNAVASHDLLIRRAEPQRVDHVEQASIAPDARRDREPLPSGR